MGIKDRLKRSRLDNNMTLEDLAKKVGVSRQTIQRYESGVISNIPDSYIMQHGGWSTDSTLKSVYRHTFEKQSKEEARKANEYFSALSDGLD